MSWFDDPPEIAHLPWRERERLLGIARQRPISELRTDQLVSMPVIIVGFILTLLNLNKEIDSGYRMMLSGAVVALFLVGSYVKVCRLIVYRKRVRRHLRDLLREQGIRPSACFQCGTKITANDGDTCPHCQALLVLPLCPMCGQRVPGSGNAVGRAEHVHAVDTLRSPTPI